MSSASPADQPHGTITVLPGQRGSPAPLRIPLTPIFGQDLVLTQICNVLDTGDVRLLTLTGPGGIGKTRIALEVAARLEPEYAHGVCFVSLAPVLDAKRVVSAVARTLGIQERADTSVEDVVTAVLRDQHKLLVLDNFEHVVEAAIPWLGELLAICPRVKVLVTSRSPLHVSGERRYSVPPLPSPEAGSLDDLRKNAAVRLFVAQAGAIRHDFKFDESNADAVRDICRQLDGIPLAIELAAARVNVMSPKEIAVRLADRFGLLTSGNRDGPERHQTMRDAIGWSYDLLSKSEQALFRRLTVFVGGFTLEAAEAVGDVSELNDADRQVVDVVATLVDHSLVRHMPGTNGKSRFWMLETIRQFGLDRLAASAEGSTARDAHAAWYLRLGEQAEQGLQGGEQVRWLDLLEAEHDNLLLVFTWLLEQERVDDAADLAVRIMFFRFIRGHNHEFQPYLEALLAHPNLTGPVLGRGKVLLAIGDAAESMGAPEASLKALREALSIFREHGELWYVATTLGHAGMALMARDDFAEATTILRETIAVGRGAGESRSVCAATGNLGRIAWMQGRMDEAQRLAGEALQLARAGEDVCLIAQGIGFQGEMAFRRGDVDRAELLFRESMDLVTAIGDKRDLPYTHMSLAKTARVRGDFPAASAHLEDAVEAAREIGDLIGTADAEMALGMLSALRGQHTEAVQAMRRSITAFQEQEAPFGVAGCLDAFADLAVMSGDMASAAELMGAADVALERIGIPRIDVLPLKELRKSVSAVRSTLGETAFAGSYAVGRAMTLEQAVAEALTFEPSSSVQPLRTPEEVSGLSSRELEVLRLMADGLTNQEIADALFLSPRTASNHAANILGKLQLSSRTGVVAYAIRHGLA